MAHKVPLITRNLWFPIGGSRQHHFAQLCYGVGLGKLLKRKPFDWLYPGLSSSRNLLLKKNNERSTTPLSFFQSSSCPPLASLTWLSCPFAVSACWDLWNTPTSGIWSPVLRPFLSLSSSYWFLYSERLGGLCYSPRCLFLGLYG